MEQANSSEHGASVGAPGPGHPRPGTGGHEDMLAAHQKLDQVLTDDFQPKGQRGQVARLIDGLNAIPVVRHAEAAFRGISTEHFPGDSVP